MKGKLDSRNGHSNYERASSSHHRRIVNRSTIRYWLVWFWNTILHKEKREKKRKKKGIDSQLCTVILSFTRSTPSLSLLTWPCSILNRLPLPLSNPIPTWKSGNVHRRTCPAVNAFPGDHWPWSYLRDWLGHKKRSVPGISSDQALRVKRCVSFKIPCDGRTCLWDDSSGS